MNHISYSQLSIYSGCPFRWKLRNIDGINLSRPNIYLIFGSAMHTTLQTYLDIMYTESIVNANKLNLPDILKTEMIAEFNKSKERYDVVPCTKGQLYEFFDDGIAMLDFFKKRRASYFNKNWELLGCEFSLNAKLKDNLKFVGYIDVILKNNNTGKLRIIDIKTSTRGWRNKEKKDKSKLAQLLLYKYFYSEKYDVDMDDVDVEYFILKRKLWENVDFPQKRIQIFKPANGKVSINRVKGELFNFIEKVFDEQGNYLTSDHDATPSKDSCRWCEFNQTKHCDKGIR